jgi:hypothetical protein
MAWRCAAHGENTASYSGLFVEQLASVRLHQKRSFKCYQYQQSDRPLSARSGHSNTVEIGGMRGSFRPQADILASLDIGACGHRSAGFRCPNPDCNKLRSSSTTLPADRMDACSWLRAIQRSMIGRRSGIVRGCLNRQYMNE